jgi:hypothetical protein
VAGSKDCQARSGLDLATGLGKYRCPLNFTSIAAECLAKVFRAIRDVLADLFSGFADLLADFFSCLADILAQIGRVIAKLFEHVVPGNGVK